jgi:putative serine protease PepD
MRRRLVAGVAAAALALGGGVVGGLIGYAAIPTASTTQASSATAVSAAPILDRSSLASVAAAVQPAVVDITTDVAEGSGVVISSDGYIVTNSHVIEGARSLTVTFTSGEQADATIVGADAEADIAVLHVDRDGLTAASWGDSDNVLVGDTVLAMGSPLGLQGSVTAGIVSALHRELTVGDSQQQARLGRAETISDAIQTDAPINSGNSGGALVNTNGEVIGINTAIATAGSSGNVGVGFAISANTAKAVVADILASR